MPSSTHHRRNYNHVPNVPIRPKEWVDERIHVFVKGLPEADTKHLLEAHAAEWWKSIDAGSNSAFKTWTRSLNDDHQHNSEESLLQFQGHAMLIQKYYTEFPNALKSKAFPIKGSLEDPKTEFTHPSEFYRILKRTRCWKVDQYNSGLKTMIRDVKSLRFKSETWKDSQDELSDQLMIFERISPALRIKDLGSNAFLGTDRELKFIATKICYAMIPPVTHMDRLMETIKKFPKGSQNPHLHCEYIIEPWVDNVQKQLEKNGGCKEPWKTFYAACKESIRKSKEPKESKPTKTKRAKSTIKGLVKKATDPKDKNNSKKSEKPSSGGGKQQNKKP